MPSLRDTTHIRIGELADRAGVSVATIKYYIREGVLPRPPVKTGRTMGYYDEAYLERLLLIRRLRDVHYLPLRVIRTLLAEHGDKPLPADEAEILARVTPRVAQKLDPGGDAPDARRFGANDIIARYPVTNDELDLLVGMGLVGEYGRDGLRFTSVDLALFDALFAAERAGLSRERFPIETLGHYVEMMGELARREIRVFLRHASANVPPDELESVAERAVEVTEPIVALIRRKSIVRALRAELRHQQSPNAEDKP